MSRASTIGRYGVLQFEILHLALGTNLCTANDAIDGKQFILVTVAFSHRPEEATLFVMVKACLQFTFFLFTRALKEHFLLLYYFVRIIGLMKGRNCHIAHYIQKQSVLTPKCFDGPLLSSHTVCCLIYFAQPMII